MTTLIISISVIMLKPLCWVSHFYIVMRSVVMLSVVLLKIIVPINKLERLTLVRLFSLVWCWQDYSLSTFPFLRESPWPYPIKTRLVVTSEINPLAYWKQHQWQRVLLHRHYWPIYTNFYSSSLVLTADELECLSLASLTIKPNFFSLSC